MRALTTMLQAGRLTVTVRHEELPLEDCVTYATRQNPRRLYLFVSKVLGKHWPVRPSVMRDVHARLAAKVAALPGPLLVIGMAETATALGRGVAEEAALQTGRDDILYLQTTRYRLLRPQAFSFDECHSHAPDHAVYLPDAKLQPLFRSARTLVLVDDEISTGRTLAELARAYSRLNPGVEQMVLVCITNWLSDARRWELTALLERPVLFPALVEGEFQFELDPTFPPPVLPSVVVSPSRGHDDIVTDPARTGLVAGRWNMNPIALWERVRVRGIGEPLAVFGTGEYAYTPFRWALALEEEGHDVWFQSTTRSPILVGDAIASRREFPDHCGDGIPNYLYNHDPARLPVIVYEHPAMLTHCLAGEIGGFAFTVEELCRAS
ncbi:MAG: phosphoribosyltransferase domain-containing protein [Candidatus Competibacteraceae bacterium]